MKIDIWSDVACPWCYIGSTRLNEALSRFPHADQVEVTWHSFQLDPTLPEHYDGSEPDYLSRVKGMPTEQVEQMLGQVTELGAQHDLAFRFADTVVANSWKAHRLIQFASAQDRAAESRTRPRIADRVEHALFVAHFEDGKDIGDVEVLVAAAASAGMDADSARAAVTTDEHDERIRDDVRTAQEMGASGVPFFVLADKYAIPGAVDTAMFEQALQQVWDETRPQPLVRNFLGETQSGEACGPDGC